MAQNAKIEIQNNTHFERLLTTDKDMQRKLQKLVKDAVKQSVKKTRKDTRGVMSNDPRHAYKAVRGVVYKKIFGGNVNILQSRKASGTRVKIERDSTRKSARGGNRCSRSSDTERRDSYYGADRGFILRFINAGTGARTTRYGNRGSISARNWFGASSYAAMQSAVANLERMIDKEIQDTKV